jgi:hypothetical protein
MRMQQRVLSREAVFSAVGSLEIIEAYPTDKYLPSYLLYARHGTQVFHIQVAVDIQGESIRIVTMYVPTKDKWEENFKTRRRR